MPIERFAHRISFMFLCTMPFLAGGLMARPLRGSGVSTAIGLAHFSAICMAVWLLGVRRFQARTEQAKRLLLAGIFLVTPFALVALLWVGLGTPWDATPSENRMRYLVLLASALSVATSFILLGKSLNESRECVYTPLGFATSIFAGAAYMVWLTLHVAVYDLKIREGSIQPAVSSLVNLFDTLLFAACVLTYLTTAIFAAAMGRVGWLGRTPARVFVVLNLILVFFVVLRGLSFPDPASDATPWYLRPGFIAGIPAVPWIMPCLLGVVLLRRAGNGHLARIDSAAI